MAQYHRDHCLNLFKNYLSDIPKWNSVILNTEYKRFLEKNNEKKFERLIRATFLTYTKILSSVKMNEKKARNDCIFHKEKLFGKVVV